MELPRFFSSLTAFFTRYHSSFPLRRKEISHLKKLFGSPAFPFL